MDRSRGPPQGPGKRPIRCGGFQVSVEFRKLHSADRLVTATSQGNRTSGIPARNPGLPGILKGLLLPFILSFLPILAGVWEARRLEEYTDILEMRRLQRATDPLAARLHLFTTPSFWPGELTRRITNGILERLGKVPHGSGTEDLLVPTTRAGRTGDSGSFGEILSRAVRKSGIRGMPRFQVWGVEIVGPNPLEVEFCRNPGLEATKASIYRMLLKEICRQSIEGVSDLPAWEKAKFTTMFGAAVKIDFFLAEYRGKPFPVLTPEGYGYLSWDVIRFRGKPVGAFMMFFPSGEAEMTKGPAWSLLNWTGAIGFPAFIEFPTLSAPTASGLLLHPRLEETMFREILLELQRRMIPTPPVNRDADAVGAIWLPTGLEGRILRHGEAWFRVCKAAPEAGHVGLLMGRVKGSGPVRPSGLVRGIGAFLAVVWLFLVSRGLFLGAWPDLKIVQALLLWFFGLASVALVLGAFAGAAFLVNHEENLKDGLVRDMWTTLSAIESECSRLETDQEMSFRQFFKGQGIGNHLLKLRKRRDDAGLASFKKKIWSLLKKRHIHPSAVLLIGHRGFFSYLEQLGLRGQTMRGWLEMLRGAWSSKLATETPAITAAYSLETVASAPLRPLAQDPGPFPDSSQGTAYSYSLTEPSAIFAQKFLGANSSQSTFFRAQKTLWGKSFSMNILVPVIMDRTLWFLMGFLWNQELAFEHYFRDTIPRWERDARSRANPFQIAVMVRAGRGIRTVLPEKLPKRIRSLVENSGGNKALIEFRLGGVPMALCVLPSRRANGFVLVAFTSLDPFQKQVRRDGQIMGGLTLLCLALLGVAASALARWLGTPLARMSSGLEQISRGNLEIVVGENRDDELGEAGKTLDGMTRSLSERATLTRFVAPQVLEAVSGGDLQKALKGQMREVTVLASDIRDFTTISETRPPREVFSMLNRHLKSMTAAIQEYGGVVDRFIGDAVVAVFYPSGEERPEARAFAAARAMMAAHSRLVSESLAGEGFPYSIGIGIDAGRVLAGALGDEEVRLDFSILGEPQNRAATLESLSKKGKASRIIVSQRVRETLPPAIRFLPLPGEPEAWEAEETGNEPASRSGGENPPQRSGLPVPDMKENASPIGAQKSGLIPDPGAPGTSSSLVDRPAEGFQGEGKLPPPASTTGSKGTAAARQADPWSSENVITGLLAGALLLVASSGYLLFLTAQEAEQEKIRGGIVEMAGMVPERLDPATFFTRELKSRNCDPLGTRAEDSSSNPDFREVLSRRMKTLQESFPGIKWAYVGFSPTHSSATAVVSGLGFEPIPAAAPVFASPTAGTPEPRWSQTNVGMVVPTYPIGTEGGKITISGGGLDLGLATCSFHFFHRTAEGEFRLSATLESLTSSPNKARAGLMARAGAAIAGECFGNPSSATAASEGFGSPSAPFVSICVSPDGRVALLERTSGAAAGSCRYESGPLPFPISLRLERGPEGWVGRFKGKNQDWSTFPTLPNTLPSSIEAGLAITGGLWNDRLSTEGAAVWKGYGFPPEWEPTLVRLGSAGRKWGNPLWGTPLEISPDLMKWIGEKLPGLMGEGTDPLASFGRIRENARWNAISGNPEVCFFMLHPPDRIPGASYTGWQTRPEFPIQIPLVPDLIKNYCFFRDTCGAFFFSFDPSRSWIQSAARSLSAEMASQGYRFALIQDGNLIVTPSTSQDLLPGGMLFPALSNRIPGMRSLRNQEMLTSTAFNLLDHRFEFVIARPISREDVRKWVSPVPLVLLSLWVTLCLAWTIRRNLGFVISRVGLRGRLTAAFLLSLLPSFTLALGILERSGIEAKTRIRAVAPDDLRQILEKFDSGNDLCTGWARHLLRKELDRASPTTLFRSNQGVSPSQEAISDGCEALLKGIADKGVAPSRTIFTPPKGRTIVVSTDPDAVLKKEEELWNIFSCLLKAITRKDSDPISQGEAGEDRTGFLVMSEAENILDTLRVILGNDMAGEMFLRPEVWHSLTLGAESRNSIFTRRFRRESGDELSFAVDIGSADFHKILLMSAKSLPEEWRIPDLELRFLHGAPLSNECIHPFSVVRASGSMLLNPEMVHGPLPSEFSRNGNWAEESGEPVFQTFDFGASETLGLFYPLQTNHGWTILGRFPIGKSLAEAEASVRENTLMLLGILVMTVFLARGVAVQFLAPVKGLTGACESITRGDFSVRLSAWGSGEFRTLGEAFNSMAREAQEGRLLGRFVSDSVRELARKRSLDPAILEGKACEAVVVFAQLAGFKSLLESSSPEAAVNALNSFLKTMSRVVRDNGGEIDKFIGDKILAVVHAHPQEGLEHATRKAMEIACRMRQRMTGFRGPFPLDLGIGIVAGPLLAGVLGTPELHLEYTVIGDSVNIASRLSDLAAKMPGGAALVDSGFERALITGLAPEAHSPLEALPAVRVKGKAREIGIFRIREGHEPLPGGQA